MGQIKIILIATINEYGFMIDWPEFIEAARRNKWWDFQTYDVKCRLR